MYCQRLLLIFALISIWTFRPVASELGDQEARLIKVGDSTSVTLGRQGKATCVILLPPNSAPPAAFAAEELQEFLGQAIGEKPPIVQNVPGQVFSIVVGDNEQTRSLGVDVHSLPRDGFVIRSFPNSLVIAGRDDPQYRPLSDRQPWLNLYERASLFAVYDFLERFVAATFVFPGEFGTVIPKNPELKIPGQIDILERPDHIVRNVTWKAGEDYGDKDTKLLNNFRLRLQTDYIPNCHGLSRMAYIERFGKEHPEYFALQKNGQRSIDINSRHSGQLCFSSPIVEEIYQDAKSFLLGEPASVRKIWHQRFNACVWDANAARNCYFNVMPQDGYQPCYCEQCQAIRAASPQGQSDHIWRLTVAWAKRLTAEGVPGYLTQMAYGLHRDIPPFEIPANVLVQVAPYGPWSEFIPEFRRRDTALVLDWNQKINRKVWLWNYVNKYGKTDIPGIPISTPHAVGRYYREINPNTIGAFMESESDAAIFNVFNFYVFSKLAWNNSIDPEPLIARAYQALFGSGAAAVTKVLDRLEELWMRQVVGKSMDTPLGPSSLPPSTYDLWSKIYNQNELDRLDQLFDEGEVAAQEDPAALKRLQFFRQEFFGRLRAEARKFSINLENAKKLNHLIDDFSVQPPHLDGRLDELVWQQGKSLWLSALNGQETLVKTRVKPGQDEQFLYLAVECFEPDMASLDFRQHEFDDPNIWMYSCVEVFVNPSGDRKNYFQLLINPRGDFSDLSIQRIEGQDVHDWGWNSGAQVQAQLLADRWVLELAIPRAVLKDLDPQNCVFNVTRARVQARPNWSPSYHSWSPFISKYHEIIKFGSLTFIPVSDSNCLRDADFDCQAKGRFFGAWHCSESDVQGPDPKVAFDERFFMFGGKSLRLRNNDASTFSVGQYLPTIIPGKKYLLSFYLRTDDIDPGKQAPAIFVYFNDGVNHSYPALPVQSNMPWTYNSFEVISQHQPGSKPYVRMYSVGGIGTAWFDYLRFEPID